MKEMKSEKLGLFENIFGNLFFLSTQLEAVGSRFLGELTTKQWFLLAAITTFYKNPPTISETAAVIGLSHQNIKQLSLRMEEKGFLKIKKDEKDHRISRLVVTEKAWDYGRKNQDKNEAFIKAFFKDISEEEAEKCLKTLVILGENIKVIKNGLMKEGEKNA